MLLSYAHTSRYLLTEVITAISLTTLHVLNNIRAIFLMSIIAIVNMMLFWALNECVILPFFRTRVRRFAIACAFVATVVGYGTASHQITSQRALPHQPLV